MEDEKYNKLLSRINVLEQHLINQIVPIQGISDMFKDKHYLDAAIVNLTRVLSKPLKLDAQDVEKVKYSIEKLAKDTHNMHIYFCEIEEKLNKIDILKFAEEMKFMAKRIYEMERRLANIDEVGIKKNISLDFIVDGYQMVRKSKKNPDICTIEESMDDHNLEEALLTLTDRERIVLYYRFGLLGYKKSTQEVTGKACGVGRERVGQIEQKALRKLRHPSRKELVRKIKHKGLLEKINPNLLEDEDQL